MHSKCPGTIRRVTLIAGVFACIFATSATAADRAVPAPSATRTSAGEGNNKVPAPDPEFSLSCIPPYGYAVWTTYWVGPQSSGHWETGWYCIRNAPLPDPIILTD